MICTRCQKIMVRGTKTSSVVHTTVKPSEQQDRLFYLCIEVGPSWRGHFVTFSLAVVESLVPFPLFRGVTVTLVF